MMVEVEGKLAQLVNLVQVADAFLEEKVDVELLSNLILDGVHVMHDVVAPVIFVLPTLAKVSPIFVVLNMVTVLFPGQTTFINQKFQNVVIGA
jgi:hypothetical protein